MTWSRRLPPSRLLGLSAAVFLAGCPAPADPKPPPQPSAKAVPPLAPIAQQFAKGIPARAFDDPRRAERVRSVMGELDIMLRDAQSAPGKGHPALAAGVVVDGDLIWSRGYGKRTDSGGAVDDTTVFRIGSITKTITAMAALRLRDQGKLDLDRPAHQYLPALGGVRYPTTDDLPLTVREMLTHTSGLTRNAHVDLPKDPTGKRTTMSEAQLLTGFDGMLLQTPTLDAWRYSNLAVGTVGVLVGKIEGKPYRDVVNTTILAPLGMRSTYWRATDVPADKLASGHTKNGTTLTHDQHLQLGALEGAGAIYASSADMARFIALQLSAWPPRSDPDPTANILRRSSLRESHTMFRFSGMRANVKDDGSPYANANGTGLGWQVQQSCQIDHLVWHNGATAGYTAALYMAPRHGIGIILLSSGRHSVTGLADRALHKLIADAELKPRADRAGPALQRIVDGPIARSFGSGNMTEADFTASFTTGFRTAIPLDRINGLQKTIFDKGGACTFARYLAVPSPSEAWIQLTCETEQPVALHITLTQGSPQQVAGYLVRPLRTYQADEAPSARCKAYEPENHDANGAAADTAAAPTEATQSTPAEDAPPKR